MTDLARVLVVDDYPECADVLATLVHIVGRYDVRQAHTGRAALSQIARFDPQLVMIDIGLPDVDGFAIARAVRARCDRRQPYLVAVTGHVDPSRWRESLAAGFDRCVVKPPNVATVREVLESAAQKVAVTG